MRKRRREREKKRERKMKKKRKERETRKKQRRRKSWMNRLYMMAFSEKVQNEKSSDVAKRVTPSLNSAMKFVRV